jgi:putative FmdB family regulatory protein
MPMFDYRCRACGSAFEALVRGSDAAPPACPACGAAGSERCVSAPVAPATYKATLAAGRAAAAREGHFSNYSRAERERR